ncbi:PQQ-dependent sugar dehydrogenase [Flavobacterium sp.]|uniref:PQQ-dependent sugar dehydrogenase n=1 Tax=Flavobacterium sp. TaxID=239 RepID=UPI003526E0F0
MKRIITFCILCTMFTLHAQLLDITSFASGFSNPVAIVNANDSRLFVVEKAGLIKILNSDGTTNATPFLNVSGLTTSSSERGLLGLAFHPNYATNGYFYINYTRSSDGSTIIARYTRNATNPDIADASSAQILLTISQPYANHNGGTIAFGSDGYLYIGMGDGGSGGDPLNSGQNLNSFLGKILRIDVNTGSPYGIPSNNPFVGVAGLDEIWAFGVRNPWKFSFNRLNGDLWIADVGQNAIEEINKATSTSAGLNYGWRCYEGNSVYNTSGCASSSTMTFPFAQYTHAATSGCSITGGYVYTGTLYPNLQNKYIFADYCTNKIGFIDAVTGGTITWTSAYAGNYFTTFGEDVNGELYVAGMNSGVVYKIVDTTTMNAESFSTTKLSITPNPFINTLTVTNNQNLPLQQILIQDISGKIITETFLNTNNQITTIELPNLPNGIYFATIISENNNVFTTKLIK